MKKVRTGLYYKSAMAVVAVIALVVPGLPYLIPVVKGPEGSIESLITPQGSFLKIDGVSLYIEDMGPEEAGHVIVLLHGFGGSTYSWRDNAPFLAELGYRVISLDMKGFGLSSRDYNSDYAHPQQARLVAAVMDNLKIQQAYLICHSMGTSVAFHFAGLYPDRVRGLISVNGAVNTQEMSRWPARILSFPPLRRAGKVFLTHYLTPERFRSILESAYHRQETVTGEVFAGYYHRANRGEWAAALLAMTRDSHKNRLDISPDEFSFPVLIIRGEKDTWITAESIERWRRLLPQSELTVMADTGHLPMEEDPATFNKIVQGFLRTGS